MFIKIVSQGPSPHEKSEVMYECRTYKRISSKNEMSFVLDGTLKIEIESDEISTIYIMNDRGKTIDKINWNTNNAKGAHNEKSRVSNSNN